MNMLLKAGVIGALAFGSVAAYAVPVSSTDAFNGAAATSPSSFSAAKSFDGSIAEPNNVTFFENAGAGGTVSLSFTTASATITGIRLYAGEDGPSVHARAMTAFRFWADTNNNGLFDDGMLVSQGINPDYNVGQPGDASTATGQLEMAFIFSGGPVTATQWKYEVDQYVGGQLAGVRVQELDAISAQVPEPASLALLGLGLAGLGFSRRKKQKLAA